MNLLSRLNLAILQLNAHVTAWSARHEEKPELRVRAEVDHARDVLSELHGLLIELDQHLGAEASDYDVERSAILSDVLDGDQS